MRGFRFSFLIRRVVFFPHRKISTQPGGALNAHVKDVDEQRIKHNVADGADEYGEHTGFREALGGDERVHTQSQLDEQSANGVDIHVVSGIIDGILAGAEGQKQIPVPDQQHDGKHRGDDQLQSKAAAQRLFRRVRILLSQENRGPGSAAGTDEGSKGGDDHDDRKAYPHACKRQITVAGHMTDVDAVNNVVEHIDDLRRQSGRCQLQ